MSLTLMEERRLRVFENRVLRGIFGPKREEVTRDWRRLRKEELNYSGDQTEKNDVDGASSMYGGQKMCRQGFGGKPEERDHFDDSGVDGRKILKQIFRKRDGGRGLD